MTTITTTGVTTGVMGATFTDFENSVAAAGVLITAALPAIDVFDNFSTLSAPIVQSSTHLSGTDVSANGTIELTGTGFTGTSGSLHIGSRGTVTELHFFNANGSFDIQGNVAWAFGTGLGRGTATLISGSDNLGNFYSYSGHLNISPDPVSGILVSGTATHITATTASGITFDITGSINVATNVGTVTEFSVWDGSGRIVLDGHFTYADILNGLDAGNVGSLLDSNLVNSGADVYRTDDSFNHAWNGGAGNDTMTGGGGLDTLAGGAGNDTLDGGALGDKLTGGTGDDVYFVDDPGDQVVENANEGTDTVFCTANYVLAANVEKLTLTGTGDLFATGNDLNNVITGNAGNDSLDGLGGNDTLIGGAGDDTYFVHDNTTKITDTSGHDTIASDFGTVTMAAGIEDFYSAGGADILLVTGNTLNNSILGTAGTNTLIGGTGDDILNDGGGVSSHDRLDGGAGNDTYVVADATDVIVDASGTDTVVASIDFTLATGLENLTVMGMHNGTGNAANNVLTGQSGQGNTLSGMGGNDTLDGHGGDILHGDVLIGGTGDDTYTVGDFTTFVENANEGKDTVMSVFSYTLGANFENLVLTGTGNTSGTGNAGDNVITGNSGDNQLDGGAGGNDTLIGGAGNDTYTVYDGTTKIADTSGHDTVISNANSYTLATGLEDLHASGAADVILLAGNTGDNFILGDTGTNTLLGNAGNDTLEGGGGTNDVLNGGAGNDTYWLEDGSEIIADSAGVDTVVSSFFSFSLAAGIENGTLNLGAGAGGFTLTGNSAANYLQGSAGSNETLFGGDGNDTLDGHGGNATFVQYDHLLGGKGDDIYFVADGLTVMTENANEGKDTVNSAITWSLGDNFENLVLTAPGQLGAGNDLDNTITGTAGSDSLDGGAGADHLNGGAGNDFYYVDNIHDVLTESTNNAGGPDIVSSSVDWTLGTNFENLLLSGSAIKGTGNTLDNLIVGNANNNTLSGGTGDDILVSGGGSDVMAGGTGHDTFVLTVDGPLVITDFKATDDKIDISNILTGYVDGVSDPNDFVHFTAGAPAGHMFLDIDMDGPADGAATTRITITGTGLTVDNLVDTGHLILST